jgi:hypothetical protein
VRTDPHFVAPHASSSPRPLCAFMVRQCWIK